MRWHAAAAGSLAFFKGHNSSQTGESDFEPDSCPCGLPRVDSINSSNAAQSTGLVR